MSPYISSSSLEPLPPAVTSTGAASHQRALKQTRAAISIFTTPTPSINPLSQSLPRPASHNDHQFGNSVLNVQRSSASGSRSQSRSADGSGKVGGGSALKDGDLEPYRRSSSKTSMQACAEHSILHGQNSWCSVSAAPYCSRTNTV